MKILMLTTSFPRWEGDWAGSFILDLARALAERHAVQVLAPNFPNGARQESFGSVRVRRYNYFFPSRAQKVLYPNGIPDQVRHSLLARVQLPFFFLAFILRAAFDARYCDVVFCNWALTGVVAQFALAFSRKPYLVVVRGSDMLMIEKGGFYGWLFVRCLKSAAAVCVVASDFVGALARHGVAGALFTPNGVAFERFATDRETARRRLGLGAEPIVMYIGTLVPRKGVQYLVEAMQGLAAQLLIVGEGALEAELKALAAEKGVDARFTGPVPKEEIPIWLAAADLLVQPSLHEGRSNVILEALAAGRPCIATRIKGSRELVDDGQTGFLVEPEDVEGLREKIRLLLENPDLRRTFGERARQAIRAKAPSWPECADRYTEILERCVKPA